MLFRLNSYAVYSFSLVVVISFLWGAFVFYKKAIESHFDDISVLDAVVYIAFWGFILGRLAFALLNWNEFSGRLSRIFFLKDFPGLSQWGMLAGLLVGLWFLAKRIKAKYIDWLDLVALGFSATLPVFFAGLCLIQFNWIYLGTAIVLSLLFGYFWKAEDEYRTYSWYRNKRTQAKTGYISGAVLSLYGLLNLIFFVIFKGKLIDVLLSVFLIVAGIVLVYIRSGRTLKEDIKNISKYGRKH